MIQNQAGCTGSGCPAVAAIQFALTSDCGMEFLRCWNDGDFNAIRAEWPEAPQSVFDGAEVPSATAGNVGPAQQTGFTDIVFEGLVEFELVNPSDPYTFTSPSLMTAALACILLSDGKYSARQLNGDHVVPPFFLGGTDKWFMEKFGANFEESLSTFAGTVSGKLKTAEALESMTLGRDEASSVNDIKGRASTTG